MAIAARRIKARKVAAELVAKKVAKARAQEEQQKALEKAALRESAALAAKSREEERELAARAAAVKAAAASEALAVKLAREELSAHASQAEAGADGVAVTEEMVEEVISTARTLCRLLNEDGQSRERYGADDAPLAEQHGGGAAIIVSLPLAARWVACYRTQASASPPSASPPSSPPVIVVYHGTRAELVPAITREGLRLPDGVNVRHSTNLSLMHGPAAARIFATLNFSRAALHATDFHAMTDSSIEPSLGPPLDSAWHTPLPPNSPRPASPRTPRQSAAQATGGGEQATSSVFLLLALPGAGATTCDHARSTYMFAEESQLLPCFLPAGARGAQRLADCALQAALRVLTGESGAAD